MNKLDLLADIAAAAAVSRGDNLNALPRDELRFVLEYAEPPNTDAQRDVLAAKLRTHSFILQFLFSQPDPDLARFLVLSIPGVERTLPSDALFGIAYALIDALQLVSAEPDLGTPLFTDPEPPEKRMRLEQADLLGPSCWVETDDPPSNHWALDNMHIRAAWAMPNGKGDGILIGQPDTGIAEHAEVDKAALRLDLAADIFTGSNDPTDPLDPKTANPGHGTSTASVVIGGEAGHIAGSAPGAKLVPIRCIHDVRVLDVAPVATAIDHARRCGCHVISLSLGGLPGRALRKAIERAIDDGIIVLAAAGNCVGYVIWPARYDIVIAVAGSNAQDRPWKGSSHGDDVDISAPAELVWRAERRGPDGPLDLVAPGQGTSYAAALTAGVAALWLGHHGHDQVLAEARRRGSSVQRLFRSALQATARSSQGWDEDDYGPGIVDAQALLLLAMDDIPFARPEAIARRVEDDARKLVADIKGASASPGDSDFDWTRYGLEVAHLFLNDARYGRAPGAPVPEGRMSAPVSPRLREAAASTSDWRLKELAERGQRRSPAALRTDDFSVQESVTIIARKKTSPLESAAGSGPVRLVESLDRTSIRDRMDAMEKALNYASRSDPDPEVQLLRRDALERGERVLHRLAKDDRNLPGSRRDRAIFEALIALQDRPALRVQNGWLDMEAPETEQWSDALTIGKEMIMPLLPSIGRIDMDGMHIGTGFVVANGIVMTNRHVIEAFAIPLPKRRDPARWLMQSEQITIDFSEGADGLGQAFKVKSVIFSGPGPILDVVQFSNLDMALLEVETVNAAQRPLPPPIPFLSDAARVKRAERLFAVGYPAMPDVPHSDFKGIKRLQVVEQLRKIFGLRYGIKYFSPGIVRRPAGQHESDPQKWVFDHDATTLGGNSGSCVCWFGEPMGVIGLHFAGDWMRANHAHAVAAVRAVSGERVPAFGEFLWIE